MSLQLTPPSFNYTPPVEPVALPQSPSSGILLGGALSGAGAIASGALNYFSARAQMRFQERMANTAHQREVADLRAAGLNPMLSATHGGAPMAQGASASFPNMGEGLGQAVANAKTAETFGKWDRQLAGETQLLGIQKMNEELWNLQAQRRLTEQQAFLTFTNALDTQSGAELKDQLWKFLAPKLKGTLQAGEDFLDNPLGYLYRVFGGATGRAEPGGANSAKTTERYLGPPPSYMAPSHKPPRYVDPKQDRR